MLRLHYTFPMFALDAVLRGVVNTSLWAGLRQTTNALISKPFFNLNYRATEQIIHLVSTLKILYVLRQQPYI